MKTPFRRALTTMALLLATALPATAGVIDDFRNSWAGKAIALQNRLDTFTQLGEMSMIGTHNSFNSDAYRSCDLNKGCRYQDPQQKYSIYNQLRMGGRFLEIDAHWTTKMESLFDYPKRLLMCHNGGSGVCSINDKYLTEGLDEIRDWLNSGDSEGQILLLYIEDHSKGHHQELYEQVTDRIGPWVYASGSCRDIPATLTKSQILSSGKKVLVYGSKTCSSNSNWANLAFMTLGNITREWEDRTLVGTINTLWEDGAADHLNASEIRAALLSGTNIVALDDMSPSDGRLPAAVWSWSENEPNNNNGVQDCAAQTSSGRWDDRLCSNNLPFACQNSSDSSWKVTLTAGSFSAGQARCQAEYGGNYNFRVPSNSVDNNKLSVARAAAGFSDVWLNHDDQQTEGEWRINGQNVHNPGNLARTLSYAPGGLTLYKNQSIRTRTRLLSMQDDGNLALYRIDYGIPIGPALWHANTDGTGAQRVEFQTDGNLVIYPASGGAKWDSNTNGKGKTLVLQADGNLVIYDGSNTAKWDTNSND
ncbi:MAG: hypothetical protein JNN30_20225 [Rhodanobacteraceae bacterium]|nr:hypothetical protein [Rhodanobacteraceae bacterium]